MSRILNAASAVLFALAIFGLLFGLQLLLLAPLEAEVGATEAEIRAFNPNVLDKINLLHRFEGLYMMSFSLALCFISLGPFRKGEKWAWYLILSAFGLALIVGAVITYMGSNVLASWYLPAAIMLVILWIVGLLLPVKEFFR